MAALALWAQASVAQVPPVIVGARLDAKAGVALRTLVVPETVYVGQQALYQVGVFVTDEVRVRLRRNPEFVPPELRALLAYDPPGSYALYRDVVAGGRHYEVHVFQRAVFPLSAGAFEIPPARLSYAVPQSNSFFSREETFSIRSAPARLVAKDPPTIGRPPDWNGAVGVLTLETRGDARAARVGDPFTLTLRVSGDGNINLLPRPTLTLDWATVVPGSERVALDSAPLRVRGTKDFDWVVTPTRAGRHELRAQRYPYFNPYTAQYEVAVTAAESLTVAPGTLAAPVVASVDDASQGKPLSVRREWRGPAPTPVFERPLFWLLAVVAPFPALWGSVQRRRTRAPRPSARATRKKPRASTIDTSYAGWQATLQRVTQLPAGAAESDVRRALRKAGVTDETAAAAAAFDVALRAATYGPEASAAGDRHAITDRVASLTKQIERECAPSRRLPKALAWSLAVLGVASAATYAAPSARLRFDAGVAAYVAQRYGDAATAFGEAARLEPRSADAWANVGTTAWTLGDSARAAIAWQRAARLDPLGSDVRERLMLVGASNDDLLDETTILPVPAWGFALGALAAWLVGCALATRRPRAVGAAGQRGALYGSVAVAVVLAALTAIADDRESAHDLVVIQSAQRLRAIPALGADPVAAVVLGEVGVRLEVHDGWLHVRLNGTRDGWIEGRETASIARP